MLTGKQSDREQALRLLREGSFAQSIDYLLRAISTEPTNIDLHLYLAYAYVQNGEIPKAVQILEHATDLAPTSAKVHYNLGVAYQRAHNLTLAKDEYLRALGLDAGYIPAKKALDALHIPNNPKGTVNQPPPSAR